MPAQCEEGVVIRKAMWVGDWLSELISAVVLARRWQTWTAMANLGPDGGKL